MDSKRELKTLLNVIAQMVEHLTYTQVVSGSNPDNNFAPQKGRERRAISAHP